MELKDPPSCALIHVQLEPHPITQGNLEHTKCRLVSAAPQVGNTPPMALGCPQIRGSFLDSVPALVRYPSPTHWA